MVLQTNVPVLATKFYILILKIKSTQAIFVHIFDVSRMVRARLLSALLLVYCFVGGAFHAQAADSQREHRISGIYSSLKFNKQGGDLLGMELIIVPTGDGSVIAYSAFVQIAEGAAPYSTIVQLRISDAEIEFTLPSGGAYGGQRFVGKFKGAELILRWPNGNEEHLRRGRSYWQ